MKAGFSEQDPLVASYLLRGWTLYQKGPKYASRKRNTGPRSRSRGIPRFKENRRNGAKDALYVQPGDHAAGLHTRVRDKGFITYSA